MTAVNVLAVILLVMALAMLAGLFFLSIKSERDFVRLARLLLRRLRRKARQLGLDHSDTPSPHDELRGTIDLHHREGGVVKGDRDMLDGVLDLKELEVSDIMVHRKNMTMIDISQSNEDIISQALSSPHTRIPLWEDEPENIMGVLHAKDLLRALYSVDWKLTNINILDISTRPWFVPDTTTLQAQLNAFLRRKAHFALVIDEYGALQGLITLEDILEEIVGEIADEHDIDRARIRKQPDGSVIVAGGVPIRDINRALEWNLPDDEATTVAGLVIHEARTIPDAGQTFAFYDFRFEVMQRNRNQIAVIRIRPERSKTGAAAD